MTPLAVWWTVLPLAVPPPGAPPGSERGEEFGKTSPIALVVILILGLATALLIRSMTKHLRKVPESFDPPEESGNGRADDGAEPDADGPVAPTAQGGSDRAAGPAGPPGTGSP
jgi:hypothetical protein